MRCLIFIVYFSIDYHILKKFNRNEKNFEQMDFQPYIYNMSEMFCKFA